MVCKHRDIKCMNNNIESDHRVTKSRLSIMKGFKVLFMYTLAKFTSVCDQCIEPLLIGEIVPYTYW